MKTSDLEKILKTKLKEIGFTKQGPTWHRKKEIVIQVINIQKSSWSDLFFINLGVYLTPIGNTDKPKENHCHLRRRLSSLVKNIEEFNKTVDYTENNNIDEGLLEYIEGEALQWLESCSTIDGLITELNSTETLITLNAREYIEKEA